MNEEKRTGASELRAIVTCLNYTREWALDGFTAEELLILVRALWASEWDVFLDNMTPEQVAHALKCPACGGKGSAATPCVRCASTGHAPPRYEEGRALDGLHALGVDDCRCAPCRRARERAPDDEPGCRGIA